jgi:hypothetical protein
LGRLFLKFGIPTAVVLAVLGSIAMMREPSFQVLSAKASDGQVLFRIKHGKQLITATCSTSGDAFCMNLALMAGQSADCYLAGPTPPDGPWVKYDVTYDKQLPVYVDGGLVCHVAGGHGPLFRMRTHECVKVRQAKEPNVVRHKTSTASEK